MKKRPHSCNILFGILSVQCVLLPAAAAAQVDPGRRDISALSAAIEEARRSPFHAQVGTAATPALRLLGYPPAHPPQEVPQTATTDSPPSFAKVFKHILAVTYLADLVGFWAALCWAFGGGGGCIDNGAINLALWVTVPVVVPALTAGGITDRFVPGLLGSALGTVAAFMSVRAIDPDNWPVMFVPAIDAAVTTLVALALHDLGN